jgi:hypothetical protein
VPRKGRIEEIFSRALHSGDNPNDYLVSYRDFDSVVEVTLPEFVALSENFTVVPPNRIVLIRKKELVLYRKHGSIVP